jgi:hypothetical protein
VLRTPLILDAYLTPLAAAVRGTGPDFGVPLEGRLDLARLGILGHSRSGGQAVAIANKRNAAPGLVGTGKGRFAAMFLLAPALDGTVGRTACPTSRRPSSSRPATAISPCSRALGRKPAARSGLDPSAPPGAQVEGFPALSSLQVPARKRLVLQAPRNAGNVQRRAASVSLEFDRTPKGAILFTDLELQR